MSEFRKALTSNPYFITLTVVGWINIFDKSMYKDIIISHLKYCQEKEGLNIYAYVIMTNHIHLVASRTDEKGLTELLGRFKSVTAKSILKEIENPQESRKEWLLYLFEYFAKQNQQYSKFHFWQYTNHPIEIYTHEVMLQKINYIHQNPVRAGIVSEAQYYIYSSASLDSPLRVMDI